MATDASLSNGMIFFCVRVLGQFYLNRINKRANEIANNSDSAINIDSKLST